MRETPFYERLAPINSTHRWNNWAGYLVAERYQHSATAEYFATRNSATVFDTSPLFKYRIFGPDATDFLAGVLARDVRSCHVGQAQYTIWCEDAGFLLEDGVILRTGENEYWLTSAEPNLAYFSGLIGNRKVEVADVSEDYGLLAVQGPHALNVVARLVPDARDLPYFGVTSADASGRPLTVSRTGFTGDLGYELWVRRDDALSVWDDLAEAGADYRMTPMGMRALQMARLDAGLLLIDVDYSSARFAWTDAQRETPSELGLGWMLDRAGDRPFIGHSAIQRELANGASRWRTVGLQVDADAYEQIYNSEGVVAPKEGVYVDQAQSLYDRDFSVNSEASYVGYLTSFMFSPVLKRHIGLAKVPPTSAEPGSRVYLELMVSNRPKYVPARVVKTPFYQPERKTASHRGIQE